MNVVDFRIWQISTNSSTRFILKCTRPSGRSGFALSLLNVESSTCQRKQLSSTMFLVSEIKVTTLNIPVVTTIETQLFASIRTHTLNYATGESPNRK